MSWWYVGLVVIIFLFIPVNFYYYFKYRFLVSLFSGLFNVIGFLVGIYALISTGV